MDSNRTNNKPPYPLAQHNPPLRPPAQGVEKKATALPTIKKRKRGATEHHKHHQQQGYATSFSRDAPATRAITRSVQSHEPFTRSPAPGVSLSAPVLANTRIPSPYHYTVVKARYDTLQPRGIAQVLKSPRESIKDNSILANAPVLCGKTECDYPLSFSHVSPFQESSNQTGKVDDGLRVQQKDGLPESPVTMNGTCHSGESDDKHGSRGHIEGGRRFYPSGNGHKNGLDIEIHEYELGPGRDDPPCYPPIYLVAGRVVDHALQPLEPQIDPQFCNGSFSCVCYNMSCRARRAWGRRFLGTDDATGYLGSYKHPNFTAPALNLVEYDGSDEIITKSSDDGQIGSIGRSYSMRLRKPTTVRQQQQNQRTGQKLRPDGDDDDDPGIDGVYGSEANTSDDRDGNYQPPKKPKRLQRWQRLGVTTRPSPRSLATTGKPLRRSLPTLESVRSTTSETTSPSAHALLHSYLLTLHPVHGSRYTCPFAQYTSNHRKSARQPPGFANANLAMRHMLTHQEDLPTCPRCRDGKTWKRTDKLQKHWQEGHDPRMESRGELEVELRKLFRPGKHEARRKHWLEGDYIPRSRRGRDGGGGDRPTERKMGSC